MCPLVPTTATVHLVLVLQHILDALNDHEEVSQVLCESESVHWLMLKQQQSILVMHLSK